ncbi:DNA cytosine methyltransferase [Streptomyces nigrescens]|uniref:DNA (cytosine-5-)-methyltransferase n=2 Tax=Streptomyces nigrescens TaxID=1920 RepID=A0A640TMM2_STRNI|nr:DNA cytosine methyltransferase [Streptomyces libani]GFE24142.1 hypothetical protein Sliba_45950 [Streptomyces libani subsp. libani]GGV99997.1 hypothetical protein GCM10010500_52060 [Streptomyces libani subsp. libani]
MSFLYPRLLAEQAKPLYEEYQRLTVAELTSRVSTSHDSAVYVATGGDRVSEGQLRELRAVVIDLAKDSGFPDDSNRARKAEFDLRLAALLHSETGMVPAEAASRDVWAFLSLVLLPDVAYWRYPQPPKERVLGKDLTRHVFGRLWWRAQLVHSSEALEPYGALRILGEAAFDQIYARRAALGGSPHLVRAILRVWNDLDVRGLNEREMLRDFLKRLLRLAPFVLFDGIEAGTLDDELRAVVQETVRAQNLTFKSSTGCTSQTRPDAPRSDIPREQSESASPERQPKMPRPRPAALVERRRFRSLEICAGAGAQALGLERAGFDPVLVIDSKSDACSTIRLNRPGWEVLCLDITRFDPHAHSEVLGVDLISGGLPRVKATATVGRAEDAEERRILKAAIRLMSAVRPKALLLENVPDLFESPDFSDDRSWIEAELRHAGYHPNWKVLNAADFGVPQNRRSSFLVALEDPYQAAFSWPEPDKLPPPTVGQVLGASMSAHSWPGAERWIKGADRIAPALVGGSDRRGGADLGPTGSKKAWASLGVNGSSLGNELPEADLPEDHHPKLTVDQAAMIQSIPEDWQFFGGKTSRYRQIGHAMPPPLAAAVGHAVAAALRS